MRSELIYDERFHDAPEFTLPRAFSDSELKEFNARFPDCDYFEDEDGDAYWIACSHALDIPPMGEWLSGLEA